jgi:GTP-binding protein
MKTQLPKIAIVGLPNVGKSALFNRICKKRIAIVDEAEGITRDRLYAVTDLFGRPFEVIDTGGIDAYSKAPFNDRVKRQAEIAIEEADGLIMVVDVLVGLTQLDFELAQILLRQKKPIVLAINKVDNSGLDIDKYEFMKLGIKEMVSVSASQGLHVAELLEPLLAQIPVATTEAPDDSRIHLSIVGRPNVGKSSLVNYLLDEDRCVVSPIPGTTRDSVDVPFTYEGENYTLIDTAGIRRKQAEHEVVDKFAAIRTERAIERADVCLFMLDAQQGMTAQEKGIASDIEAQGKGCVLIFNKWDLVKGFRMEHCMRGLEEELPFLKHCPKIFTSATTGRNVDKIFAAAKDVYENAQKRITTHQLNKFLEGAIQRNHPPMINGKRLRIYYMAQIDINPPKFVLFVNRPELFTDTYKRYLYNQFREQWEFTGVPLNFFVRGKSSKNPYHTPDED